MEFVNINIGLYFNRNESKKMKTYFILNPKAGVGDKLQTIINEVEKIEDAEVYVTKSKEDGTNFILDTLKDKDNNYRFVACGGDGTINDVFSACVNKDNASVSVLPCGSGNDFVKNFNIDYFKDLKKYTTCDCVKMDVIKVNNRYAFNCCHFGFDTAVAKIVNDDRKIKGHGSPFSYPKGVAKALINSMRTKCKVYVEDELLNDTDELLLCTIANGQYVGGSYRCAPKANLFDGFLEVCFVRPISRLKFVTLMNVYKNGTHLDNPKFDEIIKYRRTNKAKLIADKNFGYSLDGEIFYDEIVDIECLKGAINLAIPKE